MSMLNLEEPRTVKSRSPIPIEDSKVSLKQLNKKPAIFFWKQNSSENITKKEDSKTSNEDSNKAKDMEQNVDNGSGSKISFNFLANVKKRLRIKMIYRSKQKMKCIDAVNPICNANENCVRAELRPVNLSDENPNMNHTTLVNYKAQCSSDKTSYDVSNEFLNTCTSSNEEDNSLENQINLIQRNVEVSRSNDEINVQNNIESHPTIRIEQDVSPIVGKVEVSSFESDEIHNESHTKASLTEELLKLSKYGWYWGPITGDEADAKLISEPDGAFLVRDSSDDRYLLTLSFKSSGKLLHARMEHSNGLFSLCNQSENQGFSSVPALINHSMNCSESAVFCYSRPKHPGHPSFPVRLTKPVSRFTQVRSLQYLCRFVIRQNTRLDNIHKLPLPKTIKGYIEEAHY